MILLYISSVSFMSKTTRNLCWSGPRLVVDLVHRWRTETKRDYRNNKRELQNRCIVFLYQWLLRSQDVDYWNWSFRVESTGQNLVNWYLSLNPSVVLLRLYIYHPFLLSGINVHDHESSVRVSTKNIIWKKSSTSYIYNSTTNDFFIVRRDSMTPV